MSKTLVASILTLLAVPALAQQRAPAADLPLTLTDAEHRALDRNPALAVSRLASQAAALTAAETRAAYSPSMTFSLAERSQTNPSTSQLAGGQQHVTADTVNVGSGVTQALRWGGGRLSVDFTGSRNATSNVFSTYNPIFSSGLSLRLTQPLVRGFRFDATRAAIARADIDSDIADAGLRQEMATTLAAVRRAYWELVYAADALDTSRQSEALARRQLDDNRRRLELGTIAAVDIIEAEAEVAARHQAAVQAEGAWRTAQVALKQLIAADSGDPVWSASITPIEHLARTAPAIDLGTAIQAAMANRTDLEAARKTQDTAATAVKLLSDQRKPSVDLVAEYGAYGVGGPQILRQTGALGGGIVGTTPGNYLDVLRSLGSLDFPTWSIGVNVTLPLGQRASDAAYARGLVEQRQQAARAQQLELAIAAQVTRIVEQVRSAEEQIRAAAAARELAQKRLEAEQARRAAGLSTNFLVLQAQRDLAAAQTAELRARLDHRKALVDFELVQHAPV
jgi:HAE1 family hydrophobic/amphiphilic exporter-1